MLTLENVSPEKAIGVVIGTVFGGYMLFAALVSWFYLCFDDKLAEVTGVAWLGEPSFWQWTMFWTFVYMILHKASRLVRGKM